MAFMESLLAFFNWMASFGYVGMFALAVISSASVILPTPFEVLLFIMGGVLNPLVLGLLCGFGTAIGEFTGYYIGLGGKKILPDKHEEKLTQAGKMFHKYGGFIALMVFAATPLPDDIAGIIAGLMHYPKERFFIAVWIGKTILCLALAFAGYFSAGWLLEILGLAMP